MQSVCFAAYEESGLMSLIIELRNLDYVVLLKVALFLTD